jgi:hypothetical protein
MTDAASQCIAGQPLVFGVHAYDKNNSIVNESFNNGIYKMELLINGEAVDSIRLERFRAKDGSYPPSAAELYLGSPPPPGSQNNPNRLIYKLVWVPEECDPLIDYQWTIWTYDAAGNKLDPFSGPTVTAVAAFGGRIADGKVYLEWRMNTVRGIEHFDVLRSDRRSDLGRQVNPAPIAAVATEDGEQLEYGFVDLLSTEWSELWYRLEIARADGGRERSEPIPVRRGWAPGLRAIRVTPNPAPGVAGLDLEVASSGVLVVRVYDVRGRAVRHLARQPVTEGTVHLVWDGRADDDSRVASGTYVVMAELGGERLLRKLVIAH